jgi:hypothetical protein
VVGANTLNVPIWAIRAIVVVALTASCNSAAPPASVTISPATLAPVFTPAAATAPLSPPPTPAPTEATATPEPTPETTDQPTVEPTVEPTSEPTRTLAPGETPRPTPLDIAAYLTAQIDLLHLGDDSIAVAIAISDESGGQSATVAKFEMEDLDSVTQSIPAGTYSVEFTRVAAPSKPTTCTITVKDGDHFEFVSTDATIVVLNPAHPPTTRKDLVVSTSSLCQTPGATP